MNDISGFESEKEAERKIRSITLAHLYPKKRKRQEKVTIQELEDRVVLPPIYRKEVRRKLSMFLKCLIHGWEILNC